MPNRSRTYRIWIAMRSRCNNPKHSSYDYYGGRGIKVCERWNDFAMFWEDMGECPSENHSIDRINGDGNYEPSNCRWAVQSAQMDNRRPYRPVEPNSPKTILIKNVSQDLHRSIKLSALRCGVTMQQWIKSALERETRLT